MQPADSPKHYSKVTGTESRRESKKKQILVFRCFFILFFKMSAAVIDEQEWEYDEAEDVYYTEEVNDVSVYTWHPSWSLPYRCYRIIPALNFVQKKEEVGER